MVARRGLGPAFANLFTANLASSLGDGIARVAAPLLAARLTDDPLLISGIAALALLPWLFFAIPAGILVDRIDRRHALALANGVRVALAIALFVLVATDGLTIGWLYHVIFVYGAFETVYDGAIRAIVPSIVQRSNLSRANARIEGGELVV
ncbi:MAG TPA: MFS transporter, partial [Gaiellaceae bacterium]|nr:MFS transporter [Gaiellaceae bacterium]